MRATGARPHLHRTRRLACRLLLACAALLGGCATGVQLLAPGQPPQAVPPGSALLPTGNFAYRVSPLDTLQVEVYPRHGRDTLIDFGTEIRIEAGFAGQDYAISPGDVLSIEMNAENGTPTQVAVRPDGLITLPHLGKDIMAAGRTPAALAAAITGEYGAVMRAPEVTVAVTSSDADLIGKLGGTYRTGADGVLVLPVLGAFQAIGKTASALAGEISAVARARFRNAIRISASIGQETGRDADPRVDPDGRSYFRGAARVSPDGAIYVTPAGAIPVAGLSLDEVAAAATRRLRPYYANQVDVSVSLAESGSLNVFVAGEVKTPGRYAYTKAMTLLQVLAMSGWVSEVGDLDRVLLLHPAGPGQYNVYRTNLTEVMEKGAVGQDLALSPMDVVVVPISGIGLVDRVVDQYIRRVLPFSTAASFSYINPVAAAATNAVTGH